MNATAFGPRRILVQPAEALATVGVIGAAEFSQLRSFELVAATEEFVFVARGEMNYRYRHYSGRISANTLVSMPPGLRIGSISLDREIYVIGLRDERVTAADQRFATPFFERLLSTADAENILAMLRRAVRRIRDGLFTVSDMQSFKATLGAFFWKGAENSGARGALDDLFESLWPRLGGSLPIDALASEIGYSNTYLCDLVRECTGRSLAGCIAEMRMARARALLEGTELVVVEVGRRCGYDDPAYFARAFKRMHGVTPLCWRLSARPFDARFGAATLSFETMAADRSAHLQA